MERNLHGLYIPLHSYGPKLTY